MAGCDLVTGMLLSQIVFWNLPDKNGNSKLRIKRKDKMWIAKTYEEWYSELRVTKRQAIRAVANLKNLRLIETELFKFNGAPVVHYHLNKTRFMELLEAEMVRQGLVGEPCRTTQQVNSKNPIVTKGNNPLSPNVTMNYDKKSLSSLTEITTEITASTPVPQKPQTTCGEPCRTTSCQDTNIEKCFKNKIQAESNPFKIPDKITEKISEPENIKLLNMPDKEIIKRLPDYLDDDDKREKLEYDIEQIFNAARYERVSDFLVKKLKNLNFIIEKFDIKQYRAALEIAKKRNKIDKLSYLKNILLKAFAPNLYKKIYQ